MAFAPAVLLAVGLVVAASLAVLFLWQRQQAKSSVNRLARKASVDEIPQVNFRHRILTLNEGIYGAKE